MRHRIEFLPMPRGHPRDQPTGISPWRESSWLSPSSFFTASPWQTMRRMHEDMDRLFGQFFDEPGDFGELATQAAGQWSPRLDVSQNDQEWRIEAELPGVKKEDVDVDLRDHHLILRAEVRQETPAEEGAERRYTQRERRYGYFSRVMPLPENVDEDAIRCDFRDGVLTVHVPKTEKARQQGRRIPIHDMDQLPAETATGRKRSAAEMRMTQSGNGKAAGRKEPATAGAKGGEKTAARTK